MSIDWPYGQEIHAAQQTVTASEREVIFEALTEAVKIHSLGQISHALYDMGREYRRNM